MVLGTSLNDILLEVIGILETMKVTGCIAGMSGPPSPDVLTKIQTLKSKLNKPDPVHLSQYHFIEDNGQKA